MPAAHIGTVKLWRFYADHPIGVTDSVAVESSRVCPECPHGVTHRLAEREFNPPYGWKPIGYRCSTCGAIFVGKQSLV